MRNMFLRLLLDIDAAPDRVLVVNVIVELHQSSLDELPVY
jgi:hypothetical protein